MTRLLVFLFSFFSCFNFALAANFLVVEGQITDAAGLVPVEESDVDFILELYDPTGSCLLYQEFHDNNNMTGTKGLFSFKLGDGGTSNNGSYIGAFNNNPSPASCISGSYTPAVGDHRILRISYNDNINGLQTLQQDIEIGAAAFALSAQTLDGFLPADFLQMNAATAVLTQANLESIFDNATSVTELRNLIDGTSTQYNQGAPTAPVNNNNQPITNVAAPTNANDAANKNYVDTSVGQSAISDLSTLGAGDSGQVLTWDGTQWVSQTATATDTTKLPLDGTGVMTGNLDMGSNPITNISTLATAGNATVGGLVGIGSIAPSYNLDIRNDGAATLFIAGSGASSFDSPRIIAASSDGTAGAPTVIPANKRLLTLDAKGYDGTTYETGANIIMTSTENWSGSGRGSKIEFYTTADATVAQTKRMTIDQSGHVRIGSSGIAEAMLDVEGAIKIGYSSICGSMQHGSLRSSAGNIEICDGAGTWNAIPASAGDFFADGSVPMTGTLDLGGYNVIGLLGGSTASPSLSFAGDIDTGFYSPGVDILGFAVGGIEKARIDNGGLGVEESISIRGTASGGLLRLEESSGYQNDAIELRGPAGDMPATYTLEFPSNAPSAGEYLEYNGAGFQWASFPNNVLLEGGNAFTSNLVMGTNDAFSLIFRTNGTDQMDIDQTGEVTIQNGLTVNNMVTANGFQALASDFTASAPQSIVLHADQSDSSGSIRFETGSSMIEHMRIRNNGYVGIGIINPQTKLHIDGPASPGNGLCLTSDGNCGAIPNGGEISAEATLNTGADYAEYFESEESLVPGDLVGLNPQTGKARSYQPGDHLLGIVSTDPGVVGNSDLADDKNTVLVGLVGQVPFKDHQVRVENGKLYTQDHKPVGYLLASGNVYINLSSGSNDEQHKRDIQSLKQENQDLKKRLEALETLLRKNGF